jgi:hypothetical protein
MKTAPRIGPEFTIRFNMYRCSQISAGVEVLRRKKKEEDAAVAASEPTSAA